MENVGNSPGVRNAEFSDSVENRRDTHGRNCLAKRSVKRSHIRPRVFDCGDHRPEFHLCPHICYCPQHFGVIRFKDDLMKFITKRGGDCLAIWYAQPPHCVENWSVVHILREFGKRFTNRIQIQLQGLNCH